jgi:hypothetical protein
LETQYAAPIGRAAQPGNSAVSNSQAGSRDRLPGILAGGCSQHQAQLVNALTVRPSSSVDKYRNQILDAKKVGADLNVDTLLTGSFVKDGDDLRITTQLVDVTLDKILWQDAIDLKYDKLLTVQDRVAQQIIKGLELNLPPAEAANLKPEGAINPLAYEYYLRGVDLYSLTEFATAMQMLEKSAAIEPKYALTWAHLGQGVYDQCVTPVRRA